MRLLHLSSHALPWTTGGTEVFVAAYVQALGDLGHENLVAVHRKTGVEPAEGAFEHAAPPVRVLPPVPGANDRLASYSRDAGAAPGFAELLREFAPDVVHFHDRSTLAGLTHLCLAKHHGAAVFATMHSPGFTCPQHALLRNGRTICDGELRPVRCTACRLRDAGLFALPASLLARVDVPVPADGAGRVARLLSSRTMTRAFTTGWQRFAAGVDGLQVLAAWSRDVALLNGADPAKVRLVPTGGPPRLLAAERRPKRSAASGRLELVYAGRCAPVKGMHVLIRAVQSLPADVPLRVTFLCPRWDDAYGRETLARIGTDDQRLICGESAAPGEMRVRFSEFDAAVVPSLCLETGPLTVLEAFAAGLPVIGSRLGGISERVRDGVDGLLFVPGDPDALASALDRLLTEPALLDRLRDGLPAARTMADMASEMIGFYQEVLCHRYHPA